MLRIGLIGAPDDFLIGLRNRLLTARQDVYQILVGQETELNWADSYEQTKLCEVRLKEFLTNELQLDLIIDVLISYCPYRESIVRAANDCQIPVIAYSIGHERHPWKFVHTDRIVRTTKDCVRMVRQMDQRKVKGKQ